jgi:hypothetical protein
LKDSLAQKDVKIRNLELEIEKLKTSLAEINLTKKVESTTSPTAPSEEPISQAAAGAATAAAEEGTDGVVSSNAVTDDSADVELPHNSNALTE